MTRPLSNLSIGNVKGDVARLPELAADLVRQVGDR